MAKINHHFEPSAGTGGKIAQFMQINIIGKAKQFVGNSRKFKLQQKSAHTHTHMLGLHRHLLYFAHTFSHTLVCLLKVYLTHEDFKITQMRIML